ncbi:MAG TPA: penicillin acylase family protein [Anaerolineaceae bacterium]|nr:penicillin acylase family protein [Anaerolineaceae bacterium]HPN54109.1 penicillin acylase family protein [Anaerolineaceae bacterium]
MTLNDIIAPVLGAGLKLFSRRSLPKISGTLNLKGLDQPVEILRDRWGIPHIFARSIPDATFAQGFVHAQDRLWQMELNRRTATGRLSELFGPIALDTDRAARTFGFARLGAADLQMMDKETRAAIQAYTDGINAFLNQPGRKLPVEFTLLGITPEPWTLEDSMAFSRLMFWQLSHAWYSEIVRARLIAAVGPECAAEWEPHYPPQNPTILPNGIEFNQLDVSGKLKNMATPQMERGQGSNCWAISGERSVTGKPYLCNDMHLVLTLPTIWYEVHLNCGGPLNVSGVSMPGIPLVLVGHNDRIAWGITLAFTDCEDLYLEKFDSASPTRYQTPSGWMEAEVVHEIIKVKGAPDHDESVTFTRHGPIISDVVGYPDQRVAVCSMALRPTQGLSAWVKLNQAANWPDFVEAMRRVNATQLNIGYADVDGNVGYWVTGAHPIRGKGDGRLPAPGWDAEYDWKGEVPFEEMPHALNPQQGYILTCNHRIIPDDYPYNLGEVWMNGYRPRRLIEMIESREKLGPEDFNRMQMDVTCLSAREFLSRLEGLHSPDPRLEQLLTALRGWDGQLTPDSMPGCVYEVLRYTTVRSLLEPTLGKKMTDQLLGIAFNPILLTDHEYFGYDTVSLLRILDDPKSWWLEKAGGREKLLLDSLRKAADWLTAELGPQPEQWQWGRIHRLTFAHALSVQKPLDKIFNRGPYPIGGDTDTPLQSALSPDSAYDNKLWSPSVRFIMDMSDLTQCVAVTPVGQSGQLGSPHYDDMIDLYIHGRYHPMLWTRAQIEKECEGTLILKQQEE